jgi:predicted component of type VI protein secretion system
MTIEERIADYETRLQQAQSQIDAVDKQATMLQNHRAVLVRNYHQAEGGLAALREALADQSAPEA